MESVGVDLRAARENKKVSLSEVAAATRISHTNLERLEEGKYKDLPGGVYNRAFIRAYCEYLGIEPKDMLARYEQEIAPPSDKITRVKEKPRLPGEPLIRPHPLATWGLVLLISIVGLYFSRHWIARVFSPYFAHSPASGINVAQSPEPPPEPKTQPATSIPAPQSTVPQTPQSSNTGVATQPEPAGKTDQVVTSAAAVSQPTSPKTSAASSSDQSQLVAVQRPPGKIRLEFQVLEKCWVSVNSDGTRSMTKIMEPGEHYVFDADDRLFLVVGNAGGVKLTINGKPAKSLGKSGQVSRILINAQTMKDLLQSSAN